jgi:hypothetical protein
LNFKQNLLAAGAPNLAFHSPSSSPPKSSQSKIRPKTCEKPNYTMVTRRDELLQNGTLSLQSSPSLLCGIYTILDIEGPRDTPFLFVVLFSSTSFTSTARIPATIGTTFFKMDHKLMSAAPPPGNLLQETKK